MDYDYWLFHEGDTPSLHVHDVPALFEGRFIPQCTIKVGKFSEEADWLPTGCDWLSNHSQRLTYALRDSGYLMPVEAVGYPRYREDHVEYKRYPTIDLGPRNTMLASIREGYETMRAKKIVQVIGRIRNYPEDCMQIIKEFLLPVPRNRAYH